MCFLLNMLIMRCPLVFLLLYVHRFQGCEAGEGHTELESLQQENEALKAQMARLSTQLLEVPTFSVFITLGFTKQCYLNRVVCFHV